jgi:hypothetical protein
LAGFGKGYTRIISKKYSEHLGMTHTMNDIHKGKAKRPMLSQLVGTAGALRF